MLQTKSILAKKEESDGLRISIMSRHTLNDGITPHPEITLANYDEWMKTFAPPATLVGDYYKRGLPWKDYETRYLAFLRKPKRTLKVQEMAKRTLEETITFMCIEDTPEQCHRRLFAEECKRYEPDLYVKIE